MKKLLLILLCLPMIGFGQSTCIPDTQYTIPGIYPDTITGLANGYIGSPYSQDLTLVVDASVVSNTGISFPVIDAWIDSIVGLPNNFSYNCSQVNCVFPGGTTNCMQIFSSSVPTQTGFYPLMVYGTWNISGIGLISDVRTGYSIQILPNYQMTYVPDDNFEQALINLGYDNVLDDSVITASIDTITYLDISFAGISDLTGIEDFTALDSLYCAQTQITNLDISQNTALTYLRLQMNSQLTNLDVSNNTALIYLQIQNNSQLTNLDVSNNTALEYLYCSGHQLTSLDVSQNTALTVLWCLNNQLTSLDVSNNTALTFLQCSSNQLTSLDVSQNTALEELGCPHNQLTSLDVSQNTALMMFWCMDNQLTSLDVNGATALWWLNCSANDLTSLDVSTDTSLIHLNCWDNQLTSLNVSGATALIDLHCEGNQLTSLDVSQNTALTYLDCQHNQLTSLDVRNGNNINFFNNFYSTDNSNLYCIDVDDAAWSTANWIVALGNIDFQQYFSANCLPVSIQEHTTNKELLKTTDLLGRETKQTNQPLFYIYDDGTVEKRIVIE